MIQSLRWPCLIAWLTLTMTGCPSKDGGLYKGPPNIPERIAPLPLDQYFSLFVFVGDGGRKPRGVSQLKAACADPSICEALVHDQDEWPILDVVALAVGRTNVELTYLHPGTGRRENRTIAVEVVPTKALPKAEIGTHLPTPLPSGLVDASSTSDGGEIPSLCNRTIDGGMLTRLVRKDDSIGVYSCRRAREVSDHRLRFPMCSGICPKMTEYNLCIEIQDGTIVGMTRYQWDSSSNKMDYVFLNTSGVHSEGACQLTPPF